MTSGSTISYTEKKYMCIYMYLLAKMYNNCNALIVIVSIHTIHKLYAIMHRRLS